MSNMRNWINLVESAQRTDEAMWVVKSKDGVEKRFKNDSSDEANAWRNTIAKKPKKTIEKFSAAWWADKNADFDFVGTLPWAKISNSDIQRAIDADLDTGNSQFVPTGYSHWDLINHSAENQNEVDVATTIVSLAFKTSEEDDLGIDPVEDSVRVKISRSVTEPEKVSIVGFA